MDKLCSAVMPGYKQDWSRHVLERSAAVSLYVFLVIEGPRPLRLETKEAMTSRDPEILFPFLVLYASRKAIRRLRAVSHNVPRACIVEFQLIWVKRNATGYTASVGRRQRVEEILELSHLFQLYVGGTEGPTRSVVAS